jgi:hypothetical protein
VLLTGQVRAEGQRHRPAQGGDSCAAVGWSSA